MKLNDYLKLTNIKLTDLEKKCLNEIRGQGSFYEEGLGNNGKFEEGTFFGWEIYESEVPGCRGALASLVKKGILTIDYQDGQAAYYINYEPTFKKDNDDEFDFEA